MKFDVNSVLPKEAPSSRVCVPREGRELGSEPGSKGLPVLWCPLGFFHPVPFLHEPLALCVTEIQNKIAFVFKLWSVNAL